MEGVAGSGELTGDDWLRLGRGGGMERKQNGSGKRWCSSSAHSRVTATSDGTRAPSSAEVASGRRRIRRFRPTATPASSASAPWWLGEALGGGNRSGEAGVCELV